MVVNIPCHSRRASYFKSRTSAGAISTIRVGTKACRAISRLHAPPAFKKEFIMMGFYMHLGAVQELELKQTLIKKCVICGTEYEVVRVWQKYCSPECRAEAYRRRRNGEPDPEPNLTDKCVIEHMFRL